MSVEEDTTVILHLAGERELPFLFIGGQAAILLGYPRNTVDLDVLVPDSARSRWLDLMRDAGYQFFHGAPTFAQFQAPERTRLPVDLMFVDEQTWSKLSAEAVVAEVAQFAVRTPKPEHFVALKLHATRSASRSKPATDWEDIRQIVRLRRLDPADPAFRELILQYGGEDALRRIQEFSRER